jgi:hypothetical protein
MFVYRYASRAECRKVQRILEESPPGFKPRDLAATCTA